MANMYLLIATVKLCEQLLLFFFITTSPEVLVVKRPQAQSKGSRDEIGGVYLPSQLERTLKLCT
jgi:hypothetical protein